jgi:hypothetical protein
MAKEKAKKTKMSEEESNVFYVGMRDPIEMRRSILESSKEMVQYLQRAEKFKSIRSEKAEQVAKLKDIMAELAKLVNKLKTALPKTHLRTRMHKHEEEIMKETLVREIREAKEEMEVTERSNITREPQKRAMKQPVTELEKLEAELSAIESKLTRLS